MSRQIATIGDRFQSFCASATGADKPFLYFVYELMMHDLIERTWNWNETWQRNDFDGRFNRQAVSVIEIGGRAVGSLWIERRFGVLYV
jgi:hypothetical protein